MRGKIILSILLLLSSLLFADEWQVKKDADHLVQFTSSTSLLDFEGVTKKIDGYIYWEGDKPFSGKNEIYFEVDLNSVETGIGKRDRDMREDVLETDKWPMTNFRGGIIDVKKSDSLSQKFEVKVKGKMFIHGKEKEMEVPGIINIKEGVMNVQTDFSVLLEDYDIEAPSLLAFIKVADEIKLHLNFYLTEAPD